MKQRKIKITFGVVGLLLLFGGIAGINVSQVMAAPLETEVEYAQMHGDEGLARMKEEHAMAEEQEGDRIDAKATLRKATDLYAAITTGTSEGVPESVLSKAHCVAVIPEVMAAAVLVGGSHGTGVASCKNDDTWSQPAFLKLSSISFGAQLGGKSSDLVLFMMNEQAVTALKAGKVTLGTDVSVAAGTFNREVDTSPHGAIAYARSEGAFAGASLSGGTISGDNDNTAAFYGKEIGFASLLGGDVTTAQNPLAEQFTTLLPK